MTRRIMTMCAMVAAGLTLTQLLGCTSRGPLNYDESWSHPQRGYSMSQSSGMTFANPGVNPNTYADADRHSTFAIDVDTASFALAEMMLQRGQAVPVDAVRTEEFINALDYSYPSGDPAALHVQACRAPLQGDMTLLRVGIQARRVHPADRRPVNLVLAVDASGSMNEAGKFSLLRQAVVALTEALGPDDRVAVIAYNTESWLVQRSTSGTNRSAIRSAVDSIRPDGRTSIQAGLTDAFRVASEMSNRGRVNHVILLSDGVANTDYTHADAILRTVGEYRERGITLTTLGLGAENYNDALLEQLADHGDGSYHYLADTETARAVLSDIPRLTERVAEMVKVQVEFDRDVVRRYRLLGYENRAIADRDFRNDRVDGGDLWANQSVTALYAVELTADAQDRPRERMAEVKLRYRNDGSIWTHEDRRTLRVEDIRDDCGDIYTRQATVAAYLAENFRGSWFGRRYDLADVRELHNQDRENPIDAEQWDRVDRMIAMAQRVQPVASEAEGEAESAGRSRRFWGE